jgi:hypothetical protein
MRGRTRLSGGASVRTWRPYSASRAHAAEKSTRDRRASAFVPRIRIWSSRRKCRKPETSEVIFVAIRMKMASTFRSCLPGGPYPRRVGAVHVGRLGFTESEELIVTSKPTTMPTRRRATSAGCATTSRTTSKPLRSKRASIRAKAATAPSLFSRRQIILCQWTSMKASASVAHRKLPRRQCIANKAMHATCEDAPRVMASVGR